MKIYFDNIEIAYLDGEKGNYKIVLKDGIPDFFIPKELFLLGEKEVPFDRFYDWVCDRVFPEERLDKEKLLKELGLTEYNAWKIAIETKASMYCDGFWVKFNDEDTYENSTVRGLSGYSKWKIEDGKPVPY